MNYFDNFLRVTIPILLVWVLVLTLHNQRVNNAALIQMCELQGQLDLLRSRLDGTGCLEDGGGCEAETSLACRTKDFWRGYDLAMAQEAENHVCLEETLNDLEHWCRKQLYYSSPRALWSEGERLGYECALKKCLVQIRSHRAKAALEKANGHCR